ncbi:MAG: hypothetical protein ACNYNY_03325, partial [Candidatus Oxydemutatoraceae bacterium WSBS_2016_MAG_OTU14]
ARGNLIALKSVLKNLQYIKEYTQQKHSVLPLQDYFYIYTSLKKIQTFIYYKAFHFIMALFLETTSQ